MTTVHNQYVPTPFKHTTFSITRSDSTLDDIETWNTPTKDLADHIAWLQALGAPADSASALTMYASAYVSLVNFVSFNGQNYYVQSSVAAAGSIIVPISIPNPPSKTLTVTAFGCSLTGAAAHAGLPGTMPQLLLRRNTSSVDATSASTLDSVTDTSANTANYQTAHALSKGSLSLAVGSNPLWLEFKGEAGANSLTNLSVGRFYVVYYFA